MSTMEKVIIDGIEIANFEPMKYWSFASSTPLEKRKKEARDLVLSEVYVGSRKMDGFWYMFIKDLDGDVHMRSRTKGVNGFADKAEWVPQICEDLHNVPNGTILIGEIYFPDNEGSRKVTSVLNCLKDKCLERQKKNGYLHYYIFDIIAYKGKSIMNTPIERRIDHYLNYELLDVLKGNYVEIAEYKSGEELWNLYGEVIAAGGEGLVITKKSATYQPGKRPARVTVKLKKELQDTIDAFIDGAYKPSTVEYSGKQIDSWTYWTNLKTGEKFNKCLYDEYCAGAPLVPITKGCYYGWASAVSFSVMKDGKPVHIAWISGIPDSMKSDIVNNPEKLVGKVFSLSAMEVEHIDGEYSLRHGRIDSERPDKEAAQCEWSQIADK